VNLQQMYDIFQTGISRMKCELTNTEYNSMTFQDKLEDLVTMIRLNPVREGEESVKRGLFPKLKDLHALVRSDNFKEILGSDAITEEGELKVVKYFKIENKWDCLMEEWEHQKKTVTGFKRYFELLFLVKSESRRDEVWFSFFEGMHQHAAIVAGLLCSKFNHITKELKLGSLTLKDFSGEGIIKSFKDPGILVEDYLNKIMTKNLSRQC